MNQKIDHLIKILESWERAYLSPSATMAIKEARETIISLMREIDMLDSLLKEKDEKIEQLSTVDEPKAKVQPKKVIKNEK